MTITSSDKLMSQVLSTGSLFIALGCVYAFIMAF